MSTFQLRQHAARALAILCVAAVDNVLAASEDVFLRAEPTTGEASSFRAEASYDAMNNTLDVFNLRPSQGPGSGNTGDYHGGRAMLAYKFSPNWSGSATYWRRNIAYGQDTNGIDSWQLALHYDPFAEPLARDHMVFRFSLWGDHAGTLNKSTPTQLHGSTFNQLQVSNANDVQAQADMILSRRLDQHNTLTGFVGGGISQVSVGDLNAQLRRGNCNFNVDINTGNIANGVLAAPCQVGKTPLQSATFSANASQFGLNVDQDLNYLAGFINLGGSWRWQYERFGAQVGYQFQYLARRDIDQRLSSHGVSPIKSNHTLGAEFSYRVARNVEVFVRGQAFKHNFVGTMPFLYNAATAGRLNQRYGYTSFGIRFSDF